MDSNYWFLHPQTYIRITGEVLSPGLTLGEGCGRGQAPGTFQKLSRQL